MEWFKAIDMLKNNDLKNLYSFMEQSYDPEEGTQEDWHPMALGSQANNEDNPTWEQAMNGPDAVGYWKAAQKEMDTLNSKEAWDVVDKEPWMNILPGTWAFKCKRYPNGLIKKLKARFCVRGDRQIENVDFFSTFAPVVNWTTVRLLLILSVLLGLSTRQVDYTAAFVQAPIKEKVYVDMPRGFADAGKCLKLNRSLYGLKQSPKTFFEFLKGNLESIGFKSNDELDPCLFISDKVICLVYVDDTLFYSPKAEYIDEVIKQLQDPNQCNMELEVEEDVAGFLGVDIKDRRHIDGTYKLTQPGLATRIVEALNIDQLPKKETPAIKEPVVKDVDGDPPNGTYSYSSVIGMMQYLQGHSRPDITYAVSCCARFVHNTRRSHEIALERIGQYLKGTLEEGLILKPDTDHMDIDCYVDSDFAGLWPWEDKNDPSCVKSRMGFVICLANCPLVWKSQLMPDISLSTMEAEYSALSVAMKAVLPLQRLINGLAGGIGLISERLTSYKTTVHEDNAGAWTLANMDPGRMTPRSKHYAIKYHWFREHLKPNQVEVHKIGTDFQKADILTKGLTTVKFKTMRRLLCNW
jgi:hypothetical protein